MKRKLTVIILLFCLLLCACGQTQQDTMEQTEENTGVHSTEDQEDMSLSETSLTSGTVRIVEKDMPDADLALKMYLPEDGSYREILWDMSGDTVYRFVRLQAKEGWTEGYCLQRLEYPYDKWACQAIGLTDWTEGIPEQRYIEEVSLDKEGNLQLLLSDADRENFYWSKWTEKDGFVVPPVKIQGSLIDGNLFYNKKNWYIDSERHSYLYLNSEFKFYDDDFNSVEYASDAMRGSFYQVTQTDERTYLCGNDIENHFVIWDARMGEQIFASNEFGTMVDDGKVIIASDEEIYLCNPTLLVRFSLTKGTGEFILGFENEGYSISHVYAGTVREDGTLIILAKINGEIKLLEIPEEPIVGSGEELELAMSYAPPAFFRELVVEFNKENPDYKVILRFPEEGEDRNDFCNRIVAELSSGGGPDLMDGSLLDIGEVSRKGYLEDMTEFCAQDRDRIWEAAWETGEVDGKNYMIPYSCRLWTLVSSENLVGQRTTWNLEQMEQCLNDSGCSAALGSTNQGVLEGETIFYYLGVFSKSRSGLIDWENGTSHMNEESAVGLMEFLMQHGDTGELEEQGERIAEGEIPVVLAEITEIDSLQILAALFQDREVYIGFPAEPTEKNSFLSCNGLAVNRFSERKEGSRAFLSYLLSVQTQQKIAQKSYEKAEGIGLAVDRETLDLFCEYALAGEYIDPYFTQYRSYNGYEFEMAVLTKKSVERFRSAFERAGAMPDTGIIYSIIAEEAPAYFSGSKPAQVAADAMHNRAQLYLDESQ